jgi:MYXO-CTERM domain-containing protein
MSRSSFVRGIGVAVAVMATAGGARADDCPLGSTERTEGGFTWCEPSVCETENECPTGSVCRNVPLCVEIGALDAGKGDAGGARLLARQRCGANKSCPQNTTCSDKGRCMTPAQADKAGLTTKSGPSAAASSAASSPASAGDAPKKACGCSVPGTPSTGLAYGVLAMLGLVLVGARRRARRA